jgi:hypothetical protein
MSTKPVVVVMSSGLFIPWGHKLIAVIESCKPPRKCSTCGVLTACKDLTGDVCDACGKVKPTKTSKVMQQRLRAYRAA